MLHFWRGRFLRVQFLKGCSLSGIKALHQRFLTFSSSRTVLCICAARPTIVCIAPRTLTVLDCASWTRLRRCQHLRCHAILQRPRKCLLAENADSGNMFWLQLCHLISNVWSRLSMLLKLIFSCCLHFSESFYHLEVFWAWPWIQP